MIKMEKKSFLFKKFENKVNKGCLVTWTITIARSAATVGRERI